MVGKTPDQFAPLGPYLVTADQVNPDQLKIECQVNGETRQSSNTEDFIFSSAQIVSYISRHMTLKPGDIIFTGTPEGVILGHPKDKQIWLKSGVRIDLKSKETFWTATLMEMYSKPAFLNLFFFRRKRELHPQETSANGYEFHWQAT
jgi:2-keto-4-pentenoate hydratase/2-oxohepta-3-ene-1,7-dioic acid hydratase in catechol pathway